MSFPALATFILIFVFLMNVAFCRIINEKSSASAMECQKNVFCLNVHALALINAKLDTSLQVGSRAMLRLASSHSRTMAENGRMSHVPIYSLNSKRMLSCVTFLAGDLVAHVSYPQRRTSADALSSCLRLMQPKLQRRKDLSGSQTVVGVHIDDHNGVWCTLLLGKRTEFSAKGECARVKWKPSIQRSRPASPENLRSAGVYVHSTAASGESTSVSRRERAAPPQMLHSFNFMSVRTEFKDGKVHELRLVCRKEQCKYCMKKDMHRCYSEETSVYIDRYMSTRKSKTI